MPMRRTGRDREDGESEEARAKHKALSLLTDRDRTVKELREKLERAGYGREAADAAVGYVTGYGYLDDMRFASHYIEVMRGSWSRKRIEYELGKRGVDRETLDAALLEAGEWDEKPLIGKLAEKYLRGRSGADGAQREKLAASLSRKGFRISDIVSVLDTLSENGYI